jgi:hypothetical protein
MPVDPIGDGARIETKQQEGQELTRSDDSELEPTATERSNQQDDRGQLGPGAGMTDGYTAEEDADVALLERA